MRIAPPTLPPQPTSVSSVPSRSPVAAPATNTVLRPPADLLDRPVAGGAPASNAPSLASLQQLRGPAELAGTGVTRSPDAAVAFANGFNAQIGLTGDKLAAKNERMASDAFMFFRALPALFSSDVRGPFAQQSKLFSRPSPTITIDGDPHLENFGSFQGPDDHAVWGINDSDQNGQGPAEWDLERLSTSAILAGQQAGLSPEQTQALVQHVAKSYFSELAKYGETGTRPTPYLTASEASGKVGALIDSADASKRSDFIDKLTSKDDHGDLKLKLKKFVAVDEATKAQVRTALADYQTRLGADPGVAVPLQILDIVGKENAGGSTLGLDRYEVLVADDTPGKAPHLLELKQLLPSAVSDGTGKLSHANADQAVAGQKVINGFANPLLGTATVHGNAFLVREIEPQKDSVTSTDLSFGELDTLAQQAATILARSHSQSMSPEQATAWLGSDTAEATTRLVSFAQEYAAQTGADQSAFKASVG